MRSEPPIRLHSEDHLCGLLAHPDDRTLTERYNEDRVQVGIMSRYGPPRLNDIIIMRAPIEPGFWVAEVIDFIDPDPVEFEYERLMKLYDAETELFNDGTHLTKAVIKKMKGDKLRHECMQRDLDSTGTIKVLVQRLIDSCSVAESILPDRDALESARPSAPPARSSAVLEWKETSSIGAVKNLGKDKLSAPDAVSMLDAFTRTHVLVQWYDYTAASARSSKKRSKDSDSNQCKARSLCYTPLLVKQARLIPVAEITSC